MLVERECYVHQVVTAGVPGEHAEVVEILNERPAATEPPAAATPSRSVWMRLHGQPYGVFEARELHLALLHRGARFVRRGVGDPGDRAELLVASNSEKDPVLFTVGSRVHVLPRRVFLREWQPETLNA